MRLSEAGALAAAGCLGVCVASTLTLLTVSPLRPPHLVAVVAFAVGMPLLGGALAHHQHPKNPPGLGTIREANLYTLAVFMGCLSTFVGLGALLAAMSSWAAGVFTLLALVMLILVLQEKL